jgi:hypothetical protein
VPLTRSNPVGVVVRRRPARTRGVLLAFAFAAAMAFLLVNVVDPYSGAVAATGFTIQTSRYGGKEVQTYVVAGAYQNVVSRDSVSVKAPPPKPVPTATAAAKSGGGGGGGAPAAGTPDPGTAQAIAYAILQSRGMGADQYNCLVSLWNRESHWNVYAYNPSGAYGIPQALPGSKMAAFGADWKTNPSTQIQWGLSYIAGHYGNPCGAWAHSQADGWY